LSDEQRALEVAAQADAHRQAGLLLGPGGARERGPQGFAHLERGLAVARARAPVLEHAQREPDPAALARAHLAESLHEALAQRRALARTALAVALVGGERRERHPGEAALGLGAALGGLQQGGLDLLVGLAAHGPADL